jgi:hypothetical protein
MITALCAVLLGSTALADPVDLGSFRPAPALALYLIVDRDDAAAQLAVRCALRPQGDRLIVRAFDAAEELSFWQYVEPGGASDTFGPGSGEVWGIPLDVPDTVIKVGDLLADLSIPLHGKGVHQIRVSAGEHNSAIGIQTSVPFGYGVSFQNGPFRPWNESVTQAYVYIPPRAEILKIRGKGVIVRDDQGRQVFPPETGDGGGVIEIPIERNDVLWTFEFPDPTDWQFAANGLPVILCPTRQAATTIRGSIEQLPDGTIVAHKFQLRLNELLLRLLAPDKVGDSEQLLALWNKDRDAWLSDPVRNEHLLNPYSLMPILAKALREQNLDPKSAWSGSIGFAAWREAAKQPSPADRWDRFHTAHGCYSGVSADGAMSYALAKAYELDAPVNAYHGRKELLYRAAAAAIRDLIALPEHEEWYSPYSDLEPYPGFFGFVVARRHFPEFAIVAPHMPDDVRELWTQALRRVVDRHLPDMFVSCRNQTTHYLVGWHDFARGSGDERYEALARRYAQRFARADMPAGYQVEDMGPDATYCGMQHYHMGLYQRQSGDKEMLDAIRRSYRFFNHTVAPEPNGKAYGGFNFSHRTPEGFQNEQYSGARPMLTDLLPEVGLWGRDEPTEQDVEAARNRITVQLDKPLVEARGQLLGLAAFEYWAPVDRSGVFPANEPRPFMRVIGDELVAVKRPGYYAAVYVGSPAPVPFYTRFHQNMRDPLPDHAENVGGDSWNTYFNHHSVSPFNGGGLTLFATPNYGNAVLAGNCSPLVHHGVVAFDENGRRSWEEYFDATYELDEAAGTLSCAGRIEDYPVRYTRRYRFDDDSLHVTVTLEADEQVRFARLVENVPIPGGTFKPHGATIVADGEQPVAMDDVPDASLGEAKSDQFRIVDDRGMGVRVQLDAERGLRICRSGMKVRDVQMNRVEIELPVVLQPGEPIEYSYVMMPVSAAGN